MKIVYTLAAIALCTVLPASAHSQGVVDAITAGIQKARQTPPAPVDYRDNSIKSSKPVTEGGIATPTVPERNLALEQWRKAVECSEMAPVVPDDVVHACADRDPVACIKFTAIREAAEKFMKNCAPM